MSFKVRWRKRIKIAPGISVNVSNKGVSTSVGSKHARITTGPRGTRVSGGIGPIRYEKQIAKKPKRRWWLLWLA